MQELEKILEEIKEMLEDNKVIELNSDGTLDKCVIDVKLAWNDIKDIIRKHMNDGWIPVEERLPQGKVNPVSQDFYEYQVTAKFGNVKDVRHYIYSVEGKARAIPPEKATAGVER